MQNRHIHSMCRHCCVKGSGLKRWVPMSHLIQKQVVKATNDVMPVVVSHASQVTGGMIHTVKMVKKPKNIKFDF